MNRRQFAAALAAAPSLLADPGPQSVSLIAPAEPGDPLIVSGVVFGPDGRKPLAGMRLFVYHTDATGHYARPVDDPRQARIRGTMTTDAQGRYEFRTIKPAPYPGHTNPAHIHVHLAGPGVPDHWIESYLIGGDPLLKREDYAKVAGMGAFSPILHMKQDGAKVWRGMRYIRLDRELAERNRLVNGWYRS